MQIEWVTVAAQLVNFLVLVWLLRKFLYRPITRAMDERQHNIRQRMEDAEQRRSAAEVERRALQKEREELAAARDDALAKARDEAAALRSSLEDKARAEIGEARAAGRAQIAAEADEFLDALRREAAAQFDALARAALSDLTGADLEARAAAAFAAKLEGLGADERGAFAKAATEAGAATVESSFELDADARRRLAEVIHAAIAPDVEVVFERAERLTFGLRLRAGGRVAQWTLDAYLDRFEAELREALSAHAPDAGARDKAAE